MTLHPETTFVSSSQPLGPRADRQASGLTVRPTGSAPAPIRFGPRPLPLQAALSSANRLLFVGIELGALLGQAGTGKAVELFLQRGLNRATAVGEYPLGDQRIDAAQRFLLEAI
ncbi:MAG: hypothetical protein IPG49_15840 [Proteobacteria bacterium]|nr:hypothetical protein [Pseudomonadota bacterium]